MFEYLQVGKEIKGWAKFLAWLTFIPCILIGIGCLVLGLFGGGGFGGFLLLIIVGAVVVIIGYVMARLSSMMLYATGELVDQVMVISVHMMKIEDGLNGLSGGTGTSSVNTRQGFGAYAAGQFAGNPNGQAQRFGDGSWICTCGRRNAHYISSCACGKSKRDIQF